MKTTAESIQSHIEHIQVKRCSLCRERDRIRKAIDASKFFSIPLAKEVTEEYGERIAMCDLTITYLQKQKERLGEVQ